MTKVLIATEKPFAKVAVDGIKAILNEEGFELTLLEGYTDRSKLLKAVADVDAMIVRSDKIDKQVAEAASKLKIVVRAGAGYDNLDLESLKFHGVVAMNTPGQNSNAVVELVIGLMIMMARNKYNGKAGVELRGKTVGIHGYGNIGRILGQVLNGMGMDVYCYSVPAQDKEQLAQVGVTVVDSLEELFEKCQYVSTHVPANEHTKGCLNYDLVKRMPKGGTLINTARKELIDEDGLLKLLAEREDFQYVADVMPEKADEFNKFADRVLFTPKKMGAQTAEANINAGLKAARQIVAYLLNGDTTHQLNK
ncbi:MAG: 3-phosphoglycerate dehydrogenase [Bacteroidetes bacterium]|nr:MAG: 3-phosphoglycerate dehydrogenase [Bacteroidota bacterium]